MTNEKYPSTAKHAELKKVSGMLADFFASAPSNALALAKERAEMEAGPERAMTELRDKVNALPEFSALIAYEKQRARAGAMAANVIVETFELRELREKRDSMIEAIAGGG